MKQKRTFVTLLLVIALLCIGVGYALISEDVLTITGSAASDTSNENFVVRFAKTGDGDEATYVEPIKSVSGNGQVTEAKVTDDTTASFKVEGLTTKGDKATITYKVENASPAEVNADIAVEMDFDNTTWFEATATPSATTINQNGVIDVIVEITLKDTPATDAEVALATDVFTVTLTANAK